MSALEQILQSLGLDQIDEFLKKERLTRNQLVRTQIHVTSKLLKDAKISIPAKAKPAKNFLVTTIWNLKTRQPQVSVLTWDQIGEKGEKKESWIRRL